LAASKVNTTPLLTSGPGWGRRINSTRASQGQVTRSGRKKYRPGTHKSPIRFHQRLMAQDGRSRSPRSRQGEQKGARKKRETQKNDKVMLVQLHSEDDPCQGGPNLKESTKNRESTIGEPDRAQRIQRARHRQGEKNTFSRAAVEKTAFP